MAGCGLSAALFRCAQAHHPTFSCPSSSCACAPSTWLQHYGEGKTWYGVPGGRAPDFERALKALLAERDGKKDKARPNESEGGEASTDEGSHSDDVLYAITTQLTPAQLRAHGVPVCRAFQEPGDFIVTFPAAYHAGFSHGFNVAEACNFALPDWLPWGRTAAERYRAHTVSGGSPRSLCFSQEQLLCNLARYVASIASSASGSSLRGGKKAWPWPQNALATIAAELSLLVAAEEKDRTSLASEGLGGAQHMPHTGDPRYECTACRAICYLSAIICRRCSAAPGARKAVACPRHCSDLCACPHGEKMLVFWYKTVELRRLLAGVTAAITAASEFKP